MVEGGGEVKCILFCEFHHTVGPKVVFQVKIYVYLINDDIS